MLSNKRIVERPWGKRRKGGWVIQRLELLEALKKGEAVELGKVKVGAKQLYDLIRLFPYEDCLIRANSRLEVETIQRVIRGQDGTRKTGFRKPRRYHQFLAIINGAWLPKGGAWLPKGTIKVVVLKPRKF